MPDAPRAQGARAHAYRTLGPRLITVVIGVPLAVLVVRAGGAVLAAAVVALSVGAALEYRTLARAAGHRPSFVNVPAAVIYPVLAATGRWSWAWTALIALAAVAVLAALARDRPGDAIGDAAVDVLGALYTGALPAYLVLARADLGAAATLSLLAIVWVNDSAAYLVGAAWGRRKLAPSISPGKSVEGLIAGIAAAVVAGIVTAGLVGRPPGALALLAVMVAAAAVAGDLWESAMKRAAGLKDSGGLLPGHGGLLDRFDAVLVGVPVGYYVWRWLG